MPCLESRVKRICIIGEVISLEHLHNFPSLLEAYDTLSSRVFYTGVMGVILWFHTTMEGQEFMSNKLYWKKWFKSLNYGGMDGTKFNMLTWLNIVRLPFHLIDEENFNLIAKKPLET